jgi:glycosyltransferase involved in cell wall biosynthesis
MPFAVLMSIYYATRPEELARCFQSLHDQKLRATQIVLVRDGPVSLAVEKCIGRFSQQLPFQHLAFSENRGLGPALHDGLAACTHEIVARVDSDDCSLPERFALQTTFLEDHPNISVVGSWMSEHYDRGHGSSTHVRKTPVAPCSIERYSRRRNPLNHPTVMFRKSHVLASGSYQSCLMFEDYFLWARMLTRGYQLTNIPAVLVETWVDSAYFARRGGIAYLRHELRLLKKFRKSAFFSKTDTITFIATRLPMRIIPVGLRKYIYRSFLRNS